METYFLLPTGRVVVQASRGAELSGGVSSIPEPSPRAVGISTTSKKQHLLWLLALAVGKDFPHQMLSSAEGDS